MKVSILSVVLGLRKGALRRLLPCLVAACICSAVAARAQEKPAESAHAAGWVVIPVEEYRVLRAKAYPMEHDPEPPPLDATLTRVDYDLHGAVASAATTSGAAAWLVCIRRWSILRMRWQRARSGR